MKWLELIAGKITRQLRLMMACSMPFIDFHRFTLFTFLKLFHFFRFITVDVNTINPEDDDAEKKQANTGDEAVALGINGSDSLFAEVRDQHVEKFGTFLQNQAVALRESHHNFTSQGKKRDLSEIHQFVKQIPVRTLLLIFLVYCRYLPNAFDSTNCFVLFPE